MLLANFDGQSHVAPSGAPEGLQLVGFTTLRWLGGGCRISMLAVHAERRREGHGKALVMKALSEAVDRGCRSASLHVRTGNEAAQKLYEHLGFSLVRHVAEYYDDGDDALLLQRELHLA